MFSNAERAGLKERDFLISINGKEVKYKIFYSVGKTILENKVRKESENLISCIKI